MRFGERMLTKDDGIETKFIRKMFWQFMIPSIFAAIGLAIANIADSLVAGMRMGDAGLAAIGLVQPIYMVYAVSYMSIGVGGAVEYAKLMGAGKRTDALRVFNMMMALSIAISMIFVIYCGTVFSGCVGYSMIMSGYYQAVGHEKMTYIITLCRGTVFLLFYTLLSGNICPKLFWFLFPATEFSTILVYLAAKILWLNKNSEGEIDEERIEGVMLDKNENNLTELIEKIETFCEKFEASARQNYYVTMVVE